VGEVFVVAERAHDALALLRSEVKRFKEKFRPDPRLFAPLHPSYFSVEDTSPAAVPGGQLRVFVGIVTWLFLLNGRKGLTFEADVEAAARLSEEVRPPAAAAAPAAAAVSAEGGKPSSRGASRQGGGTMEQWRLFQVRLTSVA
jgi:hypothetical protein